MAKDIIVPAAGESVKPPMKRSLKNIPRITPQEA